MSARQVESHTFRGELLPGWNDEDNIPLTQQDWKKNIEELCMKMRLCNRVRTAKQNETYKVYAHGYTLTDPRRMVICSALAKLMGSNKLKPDDIIFRQHKDGEPFTTFEIIPLNKPKPSKESAGDLFGG